MIPDLEIHRGTKNLLSNRILEKLKPFLSNTTESNLWDSFWIFIDSHMAQGETFFLDHIPNHVVLNRFFKSFG